MKKVAAVLVTLLLAAGLCAPSISPAAAGPTVISPAGGTEISSTNQVFRWGENGAQGSLWNYYLEISTRPDTDSYNYGFFAGNVVYSSPSTTGTTVNLNAIGRALPPGTYYWHVLGKYGLYGANGTAWTPVTSFNIYNGAAAAPAIGLNPTALSVTVKQESVTTTNWTESPTQVNITNTGGGVLTFTVSGDSLLWKSFVFGVNDGAIQKLRVAVNPHPTVGLTYAPGTYSAKIHVTDNGSSPAASNSPQDITVTMKVVAAEATPPSGVSLVAPTYTSSPVVTLHPTATDAGSGVATMAFKTDGGSYGTPVPFATTQPFALPDVAGTHVIGMKVSDALGNSAETTATVRLDKTAPTKPRLVAPTFSTSLSATTAVALRWTLSTDPVAAVRSGIAAHQLRSRVLPSGTWSAWRPRAGTAALLPAVAGATYEYQLRAVDRAGNVSATSTARSTVPFDQGSATYRGSWSTKTQRGAFRGTVRRSSTRNASATLTRVGRVIGVLVTTGPGRSGAAVYIDGRFAKAINTSAGSTHMRVYIPVETLTKAALHSVRIVNFAISSRPALELDGIVIGQ